jgi:hypothetical protein
MRFVLGLGLLAGVSAIALSFAKVSSKAKEDESSIDRMCG